jgi:hypothetical protein
MQHRRQPQQYNDDDNAFRSSSIPIPDVDRTTGNNVLNVDSDDDDLRKRMKIQQHSQNLRKRMIIRSSAILTGISLFLYVVVRNKYVTVLSSLRIITLYPVYLCGYTCLRHVMLMISSSSPQQTQQLQLLQHQERIKKVLMPLTLIATVISAQLPSYIGAAIASTCIIAFSIVTRPALEMNAAVTTSTVTSFTANINQPKIDNNNNNNNTPPPPLVTTTTKSKVTFATVVVSMIGMIVVLLIENFLIWVVSATFLPGHSATTAPPPLQDNGQHVLNYLFHTVLQLPSKSSVVSLRRLLNTQWSLVACVGTSFVVTEVYDQRRTLYGIANRALLTVGVARFIRTISFILTVVPSQNQNCYIQRGFPLPPPSDWIDWIWIGIIPRSHGGCNDLIISGHATIISTRKYS